MRLILLTLIVAVGSASAAAAEPDYSIWDTILTRYYDPAAGLMNYGALKQNDRATLNRLRQSLAGAAVANMSRDEQLAYWINLYNVNVVAIVIDRYPVKSIRDISTDPIRRLNVFEKKLVPFGGGRISLDEIEHERIRKQFRDPRIHFAINCAARSCPPMPERAVRGAELDATLDAQARAFLNGRGLQIDREGRNTILRVSKIMEWFGDDFDQWGGGKLNFIRRYLSENRRRLLIAPLRFEYADYDWSLNDRR